MSPENNRSIPDNFALNHIRQYARKTYLSLNDEHENFLLKVLPKDVKGSRVATELAVEGLASQAFIPALHDLHKATLETLSLALTRNLSQMYGSEDRTVYELATANWVFPGHARLSGRQIEVWEKDKDRQSRTSRLAQIRAQGAKIAINRKKIVAEEGRHDGNYLLYEIDSGIYSLLQTGLEIVRTYNGSLPEDVAKDLAREEIGIEQYSII